MDHFADYFSYSCGFGSTGNTGITGAWLTNAAMPSYNASDLFISGLANTLHVPALTAASYSQYAASPAWIDLSMNATALAGWLHQSVTLQSNAQFSASALDACEVLKLEIGNFASLSQNWDGYGGLPVSERVVSNAQCAVDTIEWLPFLFPIPEAYPNSNGTIAFEWNTDDGEAYLEIGNTRYSGYVQSAATDPIYFQGTADRIDWNVFTQINSSLFPALDYSTTISEIWLPEPEYELLAA